MSKSVSNTRGKILDRALEMFNERGIEYVGLRELAADLGMRVSNITYYFPTKDDLVFEISVALSKSNGGIMIRRERLEMQEFLDILERMFRNQIRFRCLMLSFVHVMTQNKRIAAAYKQTQKERFSALRSYLELLVESGNLGTREEEELEFLASTLGLVSRFWISESVISFRNESEERQMQHYLELVKRLLKPYASPKGRKILVSRC